MKDRGTTDKIKGRAQEAAGNVTGNDKQKSKGILNKTLGKVKEVSANVKDRAEDMVDDVKEKLDK